jgi:hypothetical protein
MIIPSSFVAIPSPDQGVHPFGDPASNGNSNGDARSRTSSHLQIADKFSQSSLFTQAPPPPELPELGIALRNLHAGRIRHDMNTSNIGVKLLRDPSSLAERVLHFTLNQ